MAKRRSSPKPSKKLKSFSELKGSKHPIAQSVGGEQLGHDAQLPVNPQPQGGSPLLNPANPGRIGLGMGPGAEPEGSDFY